MADEEVDFSVSAVLPAAGSGTRMCIETPKQFCKILGRPLISYTIEAFERVSWIKEIVVPVSEDGLVQMQQIIRDFKHTKIILTLGGITRHKSIFNGVKELMNHKKPPDIVFDPNVSSEHFLRNPEQKVVIHDAVRPFVSEDILRKVALAAKHHGASGATRPLVSTVIARNKEGFLDHSLERSKYKNSEMPQAFKFEVIYGAYQKCKEYDFDYGTECLHLALTYSGTRAKLIEGTDSLWKVTHKKDLLAVEATLKDFKRFKVMVISNKKETVEEQLVARLQNENIDVMFASPSETSDISESLSSVDVVCNIVRHTGLSPIVEQVEDEKQLNLNSTIQVLEVFCNSSHHRKTILTLVISCEPNGFDIFKKNMAAFSKKGKPKGILCFGIYIDTGQCNKKDCLPMEDSKNLAEMTSEIVLHTSPLLSGQVFQYLG